MCMPLFYYERRGKKISPETWPTLSTWSEHVENWAHSDSLASIYSYLLAQNFDEVYGVLQRWNNAENQWLRRLSMVSLIHYSGKKAVFLPLDKVLPMLENCLDDERPYVQKAIGWVLREANYVYHAEISAFIEQHLADLRGFAFSGATERFSEAAIFFALPAALRPPPSGYWASAYYAGSSLLTLGYGDITQIAYRDGVSPRSRPRRRELCRFVAHDCLPIVRVARRGQRRRHSQRSQD